MAFWPSELYNYICEMPLGAPISFCGRAFHHFLRLGISAPSYLQIHPNSRHRLRPHHPWQILRQLEELALDRTHHQTPFQRLNFPPLTTPVIYPLIPTVHRYQYG
jgi:hypothetical protein